MPPARVHDVEALATFQAALQTFKHQATAALGTAQIDLGRAQGWVDTQRQGWKATIRRAEEDVLHAKNELARRKWMAAGGDRQVDCSEQEKELRKAKLRLEWAEEKLAATTTWLRDLPDAIDEYDGQARPLADIVEHELPRMIALMERMIRSVEAYQQLAPPSVGDKP